MAFRILPLTILVCLASLALRGYETATGVELAWNQWSSPAIAQEAAEEAGATEAAEADAAETAAEAETPVSPAALADDPRQFTQVEVDILQSLKQRREELQAWEEEMKMREAMLGATELRIEQRLVELQNLKTEVSALLKQYNTEEDEKITSLVKIYENMKPKDAAQIFQELDMPVMLEVVDKMAERRVAPILAAMDPKRARELTMELAEHRRLSDALNDEALTVADPAP